MLLKRFFIFLLLPAAVFAADGESQNQETIRTITQAVATPDQQVCNGMRTLSSGAPLQNPICEPYWPKTTAIVITGHRESAEHEQPPEETTPANNENSGIVEIALPSWADQVKERPDSTDKQAKNFEGDSTPAQMAANGHTMASRTELRAMESLFAQTRSQVAERCCGNNRECLNVFGRVRLQFCTNPRALTHPNEPDRCTGRESGIFTQTEDEMYMQWWLLKISRQPAATQEATRASILQSHPSLRGKLGDVAPGLVSISRYQRANDEGETLWTFRHELGHACSSIRRQIATRNGSSLNAGQDYDPDPSVYCRYSSEPYQQFSFLGEFMRPENSREVGACISNGIRNEVRNRNDQAYIPNPCYGAKIEEGLAEAFALLTATPEDVFFNLRRACTYPPSRVHFTGHKIVKCIAENSPRFRNTVLGAPVCRADQPASQTEAGSGTEAGVSDSATRPFMTNTLLSSPAPASPTPVALPTPTPAQTPAPVPLPAAVPEGGQQ